MKKIEIPDSKPFRIFFKVPSKLAPATALQSLARFQVLLTSIAWPAKSPDMSCLDFLFWLVVMEAVRKIRPSTLTELKAVGEAFAESVDSEVMKRSAKSTWNRARACRAVTSTNFKGSLKKILKGLEH